MLGSRAHRPVVCSPDAKRLFWSLNGPLTTSVWIMEDAFSPNSREPYFRQTTGAGTTTSWHPASQSPLTEPKVSSITVSVNDLDEWEDQWLDMHRDHADPDGGEENGDESWVKFGPLPDYDPDKDEEGPEHLLVCCGTQRPRGKPVSVVVKPSASSGKEFVTLHDYLSTVHPWLMSLREDILGAMGILDDEPLPTETKIMVDYSAPDSLKMYKEAEWIGLRRKLPSSVLAGSTAAQYGVEFAQPS